MFAKLVLLRYVTIVAGYLLNIFQMESNNERWLYPSNNSPYFQDGGQSYVHCFQCEKCVKPTWSHCKKCKVCHLSDSCKKLNVSLGLGTGNTSTLKKEKPTPVCGDRIKSGIKSKSNHKSKSLNTHSVRRLGKSK